MSTYNQNCVEPANEDSIQCIFFSNINGSANLKWEDLCKQINDTIKTLSKDYIWHKDEFEVFVPLESLKTGESGSGYLESSTCFGDNIEDEWFIVYLCLEISRIYKDVIIKLTDNDGDFLLIEAANYLEKWANPDSTDNRVFICNNNLHIITPDMVPLETSVELNTALNLLIKSPELTKAPDVIQQAILNRIGNYPEKILDNIHRTAVCLPVDLATLLTLKPGLIAHIVDTYCNHDVIDAKCCKNIDFSNSVTIEVKFTKLLYATLIHSKLIKHVGHSISKNDKKSILGIKLMCGYEMIRHKGSSGIHSSKDYNRYISSLKTHGFFKNNIEGSKEYNQLLEKANEYYSNVECPIYSKLCHNIQEITSSSDFVKTKESIKDHQLDSEYQGDNEEWLNIKPEQLNDMLLTRYGKTSSLNNQDVISPHTVTKELSSFLKQTSDFEGIEPNQPEEIEDENVNFEADQFVACLEKMLKIIGSDSLEDIENSDDSDESNYDTENEMENECERELENKLQNMKSDNLSDSESILANIIQSMKEEKASTGPSSNLLMSMGIHKSHLLDSDDDVD